jgi:hypothetical protein
MSKTGRYSDDPRIDRAASWALGIAAVTSLSLGAWFFRGLQTSMNELGVTVGELATEVAVLRVERKSLADLLALEIRELRGRVASLERSQ